MGVLSVGVFNPCVGTLDHRANGHGSERKLGMPTFEAEVTTTVDVDFEVFCACGEGLCNQSSTRQSRNRGYPQVVVEPCARCQAAEYDRGLDDGKASND